MPDVLYHYTSLESLALILKNRTIRFSRLDVLDDPQECRTLDARNLAKTRFVSCWTACSDESIPMWREYAGADCGVRIEMPANPFARYCWAPDDIARVTGLPCTDASGGDLLFSEALVPFEGIWDKGFYVLECAGKSDILHEVEYTDDQNLLFPKTLDSREDGGVYMSHGEIGIRKATPWSYQNEWRYALTIMPFDIKGGSYNQQEVLPKLKDFLTDRGDAHMPLFYDLAISDQSFDSMKIMASPRMSSGNRVILEALRDRYGSNAELQVSRIEL